MSDKLLRSTLNLTGGATNKAKIIDMAGVSNFDKAVMTNIGFCNKNTAPDQIFVQLIPLTGATVMLVNGQPVNVNDSWWAKQDMNVHLQLGDQIWVWSNNVGGQYIDVIANYLQSDTN